MLECRESSEAGPFEADPTLATYLAWSRGWVDHFPLLVESFIAELDTWMHNVARPRQDCRHTWWGLRQYQQQHTKAGRHSSACCLTLAPTIAAVSLTTRAMSKVLCAAKKCKQAERVEERAHVRVLLACVCERL